MFISAYRPWNKWRNDHTGWSKTICCRQVTF